MKFTAVTVAAAMAGVIDQCFAATEQQQAIFKSFDDAVSKYDYDWEVYPVITDDGYKLNMFRLLGPTHVEPIETEHPQEESEPVHDDVIQEEAHEEEQAKVNPEAHEESHEEHEEEEQVVLMMKPLNV